jgi:RecA-family ATPase
MENPIKKFERIDDVVNSVSEKQENKDTDNNLNANKPNFDFANFNDTDFINEIDDLSKQNNEDLEQIGIFTAKSANKWIEGSKSKPIQKMLFGELWFERELCILFADTNLGKSILAVQISNSISRGINIFGFKLEAPKQTVLYFDFELSEKQFESRYAVKNEELKIFENHYTWDDNFIRVEINPDAEIPEKTSFEEVLNESLEQSIILHNAKVLIIDNLTYLKTETEKAKDALPLMKQLKALKNKHGLSILALAHTPKRDLSKPITRNDLQGSKMLINFCDSSFTIGESHTDKHLRYLKQIKARNIEILYDSENVIVCQIEKAENFLQFELLNYGSEKEHLKQLSANDKEERISEVLELKSQGISNIEIARRFGVSEGSIRKWIKKNNPK